MSVSLYFYNLVRGFDELINAMLYGNSRQTLSSRAYEAAVIRNLWWWVPFYEVVNWTMYAGRWFILRPLGYRWGKDMPTNHCKDAYLSNPVRTYGDPSSPQQ